MTQNKFYIVNNCPSVLALGPERDNVFTFILLFEDVHGITAAVKLSQHFNNKHYKVWRKRAQSQISSLLEAIG